MFSIEERAVFTIMDACLRDGWCPSCLVVNVARTAHCLTHHQVRRRWVGKKGILVGIVKK